MPQGLGSDCWQRPASGRRHPATGRLSPGARFTPKWRGVPTVHAQLDVAEEAKRLVPGGLLEHPRNRLDVRVVRRDPRSHEAERRRQNVVEIDRKARLSAAFRWRRNPPDRTRSRRRSVIPPAFQIRPRCVEGARILVLHVPTVTSDQRPGRPFVSARPYRPRDPDRYAGLP